MAPSFEKTMLIKLLGFSINSSTNLNYHILELGHHCLKVDKMHLIIYQVIHHICKESHKKLTVVHAVCHVFFCYFLFSHLVISVFSLPCPVQKSCQNLFETQGLQVLSEELC